MFFLQAEDGSRDHCVAEVQTCALPFLSMLALSLITTAASAGETKKDRLIYSLDTGMGITGDRGNVGTPLQQDYDVAIRINDKKFVGMTIAAVRVPMGEVENISNLKVWLSKELKLETVNGKKTNVPDVLSQGIGRASCRERE